MKVEVLAIGSEILIGATVNTNASFLSHELADRGYHVLKHTVLPDNPEMLHQSLPDILRTCDILIVTGGLGPTCDDLTRDIFTKFFGKALIYSDEVAKDLEKRFGKTLATLQDQSMVPEKAVFFCNPIGTAPAIVFKEKNKVVVLLPGVPQEMKALFSQSVGPYLEKHFPPEEKSYRSSFHLALLYESKLDPFLRRLHEDFPKIDIGIYPYYGTLTVRISSSDLQSFSKATDIFTNEYRHFIFSQTSPRLAEALQERMIAKGKTLSLAESFTGGLVAASLTSVPGSSKYFLGSVVSYANSLKENILHVSEQSLKEKGAVSKEVVEEMLKGVFEETGSDYGIALSGIAGPDGGSENKPVGTVWIAIGERGKEPFTAKWQLKGNREAVITTGTFLAIGHLWRFVAHDIHPFS